MCRSFWFGTSEKPMSIRAGSYNVNQSQNEDAPGGQPENCEAEPTHLRLGVQLKNLTKVYSSGNKVC